MGCDIHSVGQYKKDGKWITELTRVAGDDRNYDSFAVMANVRNGYGFAGVSTGEGWKPIADPRDLPEDIELNEDDDIEVPSVWYYSFDKEQKNPQNSVWLGDHSHSWLLLSEIDQELNRLEELKYTVNGVLDKRQFIDIMGGKLESPQSWCGGVGGGGVKVVTKEEAVAGAEYTHVSYSWQVKATNRLYYLKNVREELIKLAEKHNVGHNDVRIVFGFDS